MNGRPPDLRFAAIGKTAGPNLLVGLWLLVASRVLGYLSADPHWNDVACGAILVLVALLGARVDLRLRWLQLVSALVGAWLVVASLGIDISTDARLNDGIAGVVTFMVALSALSAIDSAPRPPIGGRQRTRRDGSPAREESPRRPR